MSSKPHPLDIFRSSDGGFEQASRRPRSRRTVAGKVVRSTERPRTATQRGAELAASRPARTARTARTAAARARPPAFAKRRDGPLVSNRVLLYSTLGVFAAVLLMVWMNSGDEDPVVLKSPQHVIGSGGSTGRTASVPPAAAPAAVPPASSPATSQADLAPWERPVEAPQRYTVRVATYLGSSPAVESSYQNAASELLARGFESVALLEYDPEGESPGRVELVVGNASARELLVPVLEQLRDIDDWQTGNRRPFRDARIIVHPNPAAVP